MSKKLESVTPERQGVTREKKPLELVEEYPTVVVRECVCCGKQQDRMFQCSACHAGVFCSRTCHKKQSGTITRSCAQ